MMVLAILLVSLLAVSAVSAADNATSDVVGIDNQDDNVILELDNSNNDGNVLNANPKTFTDLNNAINGNNKSDIYLNSNYTYNPDSDSGFEDGIKINRAVTIYGNGYTIDGNNQARAFNIIASNVVLNNICFVNNYVDGDGGAVYWAGNNGILSKCSFIESHSVYDGGAVYWNGANGSMNDCCLMNSNAYWQGFGTVYWKGDDGELFNSSFKDCNEVIIWFGTGGNCHDCVIEDSYLVEWYGSNGIISKCSFVNGSESLTWIGVDGVLSGCSFLNYHVSWKGANGIMNECSFVNCSSTYKGGAVFWSGNSGTLSNCRFINSTAYHNSGGDSGYGYGGAVYLSGADCVLSGCSFVNCSSNHKGGAVYWYGDNGYLTCSSFTSCFVSSGHSIYEGWYYYGGAVYWAGTMGTLSDSIFMNSCVNSKSYLDSSSLESHSNAFSYGGAVYWDEFAYEGVLTDCSFVNSSSISYASIGSYVIGGECSSISYGGAVYWDSAEGILNNCSFVNSYASASSNGYSNSYGGGIYFGAGDCSLTNPTFEGNYAKEGSDWYSENPLNITTDKILTFISASDLIATYGVSKKLVATLKDVDGNILAGEEISIVLNGKEYALKTNSKGKASLAVPTNLAPETYVATITYEGNDEYASSTATADVVVNKADTNISAVYNDAASEIVATLTNAHTGKAISSVNVEFNINGKTTPVKTNSKGKAKFSTVGLSSGTVSISYAGNSKYNSASTSVVLPTKSDIIISAVYDADNNELVATLTNEATGKAVSSATVQFNINGATTTAKTNSKGQAKVSTAALPLGTNTATISYAGNSKYNSASTKITFDVKTKVIVTDVYAYSDCIVAKLTNGATGKTIANANMIVEINGVKYDAKSDNKGILTFDTTGLDLPSAYDLTISYRGNNRYTASSATVAVDLNKANMNIKYKYDADKKELTATLKNSKTGKVVSGANMVVDLNGIKTTYKANKKGQIIFSTAGWAPGTHVGTITYGGNSRYNSISAAFKVDV